MSAAGVLTKVCEGTCVPVREPVFLSPSFYRFVSILGAPLACRNITPGLGLQPMW